MLHKLLGLLLLGLLFRLRRLLLGLCLCEHVLVMGMLACVVLCEVCLLLSQPQFLLLNPHLLELLLL